MALHMLLQMRRLLEAHPALLALTAELLARTAISTFPVTPQSIHLILHTPHECHPNNETKEKARISEV